MPKNKKMYILYDLEASKEITGGAFYSGQDFDHELIVQLQQHALTFITKEEGANAQKVRSIPAPAGVASRAATRAATSPPRALVAREGLRSALASTTHTTSTSSPLPRASPAGHAQPPAACPAGA